MRLAVNIDHIATIREARKSDEPDPIAAAVLCELAGAQGITVHLRGDRRHIQDRDVELLRRRERHGQRDEWRPARIGRRMRGLAVLSGG